MDLNNSSNTNVCDSKLPVTEPALLIFHASVLFILIVTSLTANSLVLLLLCKYKRLRVRSVVIVGSLIAADVLLSLTYTIPSLVTAISKYWLFTDIGCSVFGFLAYESLMTRWLVMGMLCIDRFLNVRCPFNYKKHSKRIIVTLSLIAWIVPFLITVAPLYWLALGELRDTGPTCLPGCETRVCQLYYAVCTATAFFIGGVLPVILYAWMFYKGRRKFSTLRLGVMVAENVAGGVAVRDSGFSHYTLDARERRAICTFVLLLITVLVTGVPSFMLAIIRSANQTFHCQIPLYVGFLITELLMSGSTLNALVVMRDRDFRHCIKDLLCRCKASSQTRDSFTSRGECTTATGSSSKHSAGQLEQGVNSANTPFNNEVQNVFSTITVENGHTQILTGVSNGTIPHLNGFVNPIEAESPT